MAVTQQSLTLNRSRSEKSRVVVVSAVPSPLLSSSCMHGFCYQDHTSKGIVAAPTSTHIPVRKMGTHSHY